MFQILYSKFIILIYFSIFHCQKIETENNKNHLLKIRYQMSFNISVASAVSYFKYIVA